MEFHFYFTSVEANKGVMQYRIRLMSLTLSEMAEFAQLAWNQHPSNVSTALLGGICTFTNAGLRAKIWVFHDSPLAQQ